MLNGRTQLALALFPILLLGCTERSSKLASERASDGNSVDLRSVPEGAADSLGKMRYVHAHQPLILKTNAFDFRPSDDGSLIVCGDHQGVGLWDRATGKLSRLIKHSEVVLGVALNPANDALLSVAAGKTTPARLWDLKTGALLKEFRSPFESDDESPKVSRDVDGWNLWQHPDIWRFASTGLVPQHGFGFTCCVFCPQAGEVATGCEDGRIMFWDAESATPIGTLTTGMPRVLSIAFNEDGSRLLAAARDDRIQLWNLDEHRMLRQFNETRSQDWVEGYRPSITFSADGTKFALYSPRAFEILVCDSTSGAVLHRIAESSRLPSGKLQLSLRRGLAFIDDSTLFSNTGGWIKIWNIETGELIGQQECESGVNSGYAYPSIEYVEFLPSLDAFVCVEVENDENTGHQDWTTVSLRPRNLTGESR